MAEDEAVDLVLLDIMLPGIDGQRGPRAHPGPAPRAADLDADRTR